MVNRSESDLKKLHLWFHSNLNKIKFNGVKPKKHFPEVETVVYSQVQEFEESS